MSSRLESLSAYAMTLRVAVDAARKDFAGVNFRPAGPEQFHVFQWSLTLSKVESILNKFKGAKALERSPNVSTLLSELESALMGFIHTRSVTLEFMSKSRNKRGKTTGLYFSNHWFYFESECAKLLIGIEPLIDSINISKQSSIPDDVKQKLRDLEAYARARDNASVVLRLRQLFPELDINSEQVADLPSRPPERWDERIDKGEKPPEFIERVYSPWIGKGLTRSTIRKLDQKLSNALDNWLRKPENTLPPHIDLPSLKEHNSRLLSQLQSASEKPSNITESEQRRLYHVQRRREERARSGD